MHIYTYLLMSSLVVASWGALAQENLGTRWDRAINDPAYASSTVAGSSAAYGVDGDIETAWRPATAGGLWYVDLGARLRLAGFGTDVRVDGESSIVAYDEEDGWRVLDSVAHEPTWYETPVTARYVGIASSDWVGSGTGWNEPAAVHNFLALQAGFRPKRGDDWEDLQDFNIFQHDGYWYVASMMKYHSNEGIRVARSRDLVIWENLGLAVPQRTEHDSCMVWAPHVVKHDGWFHMFYTAVVCPGAGLWNQRIMVASTTTPASPETWVQNTAVDFVVDGTSQHWFRPSHPGHGWNPDGWADCRDPMVMEDNGTWYMFYAGSGSLGGILGVATAPDVLGPWTDHGATMVLEWGIPESAYVLKTPDNSWIVTYNHAAVNHGGIRVARAPRLIDSQPPFGYQELLKDSAQPGLEGWAHEFARDDEGNLMTAYLVGYYINFQDAQLKRGTKGWTVTGVAGKSIDNRAALITAE